MMAVWMAYASLVALLLGLAAVQVERALRLHGKSGRWVWAGAMAGAWLLPAVARLLPAAPVTDPVPEPAGIPLTDVALTLLAEPGQALPDPAVSWLAGMDGALMGLWIAAAVATLLLLAGAYHRVLRRSRRWPEAPHLGNDVVLSPDFGPAVVGLRRALIVLPRWVLGLDEPARSLVLSHEEEHRRARDTWLLAGGVLAVTAAPWNLPLWWHLRRLRLAVELDCDARVLRRGASRRSYGDLLLDVGQRISGSRIPVAALAEPPSFLERRLKMIAERNPRGRTWRSALAVVVAGALVGVACETPAPSADEAEVEVADVMAVPLAEVRAPVMEAQEAVEGADVAESPPEEGEATGVATFRVAEVTPAPEPGPRPGVVRPRDGALVAAARKVEGFLRKVTGDEPEMVEVPVVAVPVQEAPSPTTIVEIYDAEGNLLASPRMTGPSTGIRGLDKERIDNVEVIKGAAARAIYGDAGAGGVIRITLKEGAEGFALPGGAVPAAGATGVTVVPRTAAAPNVARDPVILLDGEVFEGTISDLSSVDIESIEILKGPAVPAELGQRARSNGVIRVVTKR